MELGPRHFNSSGGLRCLCWVCPVAVERSTIPVSPTYVSLLEPTHLFLSRLSDMRPVHIFKSRIVNGACITMAINGWNFVMQVYYIPSFYQLVYEYSATRAGAMLLPITLVQTASSTLSGLVVHWVGRYRECILFGWVCWAVGLGLMSTLDEKTGIGKQIGYSLLIGVGVGNTLQP